MMAIFSPSNLIQSNKKPRTVRGFCLFVDQGLVVERRSSSLCYFLILLT
jgi:hypothetical protein